MSDSAKNKPNEHFRESIYYVEGMHCASCEILIEKELLKDERAESVEASVRDGKVVIFHEGEKPLVEELNEAFKGNGYTFFDEPFAMKKKIPFISFNKGGRLLMNKNKLFSTLQIFGISFLLITGFIFLSSSGLAAKVVVSSSSSPSAFFLFGLIAGTSSCAALIGGLVLSMSKQWSEIYVGKDSIWQRFQPHFLFNVGRLFSFAIFGALLGSLGGLLQISLTTMSILTIGVSVMMVLLALQMLGVKRFRRFQFTIPKFITRYVADETKLKGRYMPFLIGALTFFLPCGFTITAQGLALISGSAWQGSHIMFFFAFGTLPMLLAIGFSTLKFITRPHLSDKFLKIAGILVLFFGLYNFNAQLNVLGLPSLSDITLGSLTTAQTSEEGLAPIVNGKQILKMDALAFGYEPNEFKVRAGIPVRWEIVDKGTSGCTNAVISKGLFSGEISLSPGGTSIKEFTPQEPGRYKFSCWMGMVSGVIEVVDLSDTGSNLMRDGSDSEPTVGAEEIPSGASGCGGRSSGGCSDGCTGGCGNSGCRYAR